VKPTVQAALLVAAAMMTGVIMAGVTGCQAGVLSAAAGKGAPASGVPARAASGAPGPAASGVPAPAASGTAVPVPPGSSGSAPAWPTAAGPTPLPPHTVAVVRLSASYLPGTVRLKPGQRFLVVVSPRVRATGVLVPAGCRPGARVPAGDGLLTVRCLAGDRYLYTARRPGAITLTATVEPRCLYRPMCPQWIMLAHLAITIP
jgi:hypothetical protein